MKRMPILDRQRGDLSPADNRTFPSDSIHDRWSALRAHDGAAGGAGLDPGNAIVRPSPAATAPPPELHIETPTAADFRFVVERADDGKATARLEQRTVTTGPNGETVETWAIANTSGGVAVFQSNAGWDDAIPWASGDNYELSFAGAFAGNAYSWDMSPNPTGRFGIKLHLGNQANPSSPLKGCIGVKADFLRDAHDVLLAAGVLDSDIQLQVKNDYNIGFSISRAAATLSEGNSTTFTIALTGAGATNGVSKDIWVRLDLDPVGPGFATYNKDASLGDYTITPLLSNVGGINQFDASAAGSGARYKAGTYVLIPKGHASVTYKVSARVDAPDPQEPNETINLAIDDYFVIYKDGSRYSDTLTQPGVLLNGGIPATTITLEERSLLTDDYQTGGIEGYQYSYNVLVGDRISWSFDAVNIPDTLSITDGVSAPVGTGGPVSGVHSGSFVTRSETITVTVIGSSSGTAWGLSLHADRAATPPGSGPALMQTMPAVREDGGAALSAAQPGPHDAATPLVPVAALVPGASLVQLTAVALTVVGGSVASTTFQAKANTTYLALLAGEGASANALADGFLKIYDPGAATASIETHDSDVGGAPAAFFRSATDAALRFDIGSDLAGLGGTATLQIYDASALAAPVVFIAPGQVLTTIEGDDLAISVTLVRIGNISQAGSYTLGITGQGANPLAAADLQGGFGNLVVQFAAGQSRATVTYQAVADSLAEGTELGTLFIRPESLPAQSLLNAQALGMSTSATVAVEDRTVSQSLIFPAVSLTTGSVLEGGSLTFRVTLSQASDHVITIGYASADVTAQTGSDYGGVAGTLVFGIGETVKTITVATAADAVNEGSETFTMNLLNPIGTAFANAGTLMAVYGTIQNLESFIGTDAGETLTGNDNANRLLGAAGNDILVALGGNDQLDGGAGDDRLEGGLGDDLYFVDAAGDQVVEEAGQGNDEVRVGAATYTLGANVEAVIGSALVQTLIGNDGGNSFRGGGGADVLQGLGGDDLYHVDLATVVVREAAGGGNDRVFASVSYALAAGAEVELLTTTSHTGTGAINLTGNELANTIQGNDGANILDGKGGADTLLGRLGDDFYYVDNGADRVIETAGQGNDRLFASVSYVLGAGADVEILSTSLHTGTGAIDLAGNELANTVQGNDGANRLDGRGGADMLIGRLGDDWYFVDDAGDRIVESAGQGSDRIFAGIGYTLAAGVSVEMLTAAVAAATTALNLTGNELANAIYGNAGANVLDGKGGADTLVGLAGDDLYHVDHAGDRIVEGVGQGYDRVLASVSYVLTAGAAVDLMTTADNLGTAAIALTGNEYNNTLYGNDGANILDGKSGADTLAGRLGDDWYHVDQAADRILESEGQGYDRVYAAASYTLAAGVEVELMATADNLGTAAIALTGNELYNTLYGNDGANILDGKGGADTLIGRLGNDWYFVDNAADRILESAGQGIDRVFARTSYALAAGVEVETLTTTADGGTDPLNLTGNEYANTVSGNAGSNRLDGGRGNDALVGLGGADLFAFTSAPGAGNVDRIMDFVSGSDRIALDDAVFTALGAAGALNPASFVTGSAAADAGDRIVYNAATGQLFYDADGSGAGAAILFATLQGAPALAAGDLVVI